MVGGKVERFLTPLVKFASRVVRGAVHVVGVSEKVGVYCMQRCIGTKCIAIEINALGANAYAVVKLAQGMHRKGAQYPSAQRCAPHHMVPFPQTQLCMHSLRFAFHSYRSHRSTFLLNERSGMASPPLRSFGLLHALRCMCITSVSSALSVFVVKG